MDGSSRFVGEQSRAVSCQLGFRGPNLGEGRVGWVRKVLWNFGHGVRGKGGQGGG